MTHSITVYLDECVDRNVVAFLRQRGFVVQTTQSSGKSSATDDQQLRYACMNDWLMLTTNMRDYVRLHAIFHGTNEPHAGVITIPDTPVAKRLVVRSAMMLDWIAAEFPDPRNRLFRWTDL